MSSPDCNVDVGIPGARGSLLDLGGELRSHSAGLPAIGCWIGWREVLYRRLGSNPSFPSGLSLLAMIGRCQHAARRHVGGLKIDVSGPEKACRRIGMTVAPENVSNADHPGARYLQFSPIP